jgi:hypothetical protein
MLTFIPLRCGFWLAMSLERCWWMWAAGRATICKCFVERFPNGIKGRLVLQDKTETIDSIKELDGRIERVKHDFFAEQVEKGKLFHGLVCCFLSSHREVTSLCRSFTSTRINPLGHFICRECFIRALLAFFVDFTANTTTSHMSNQRLALR